MTSASTPRPRIASEAVRRIDATSRRVQQPQSSARLVSLAMGEPDFDTPAVIREAAERSLAAGRTHYSPLAGEHALREALAPRVEALSGASTSPEDVLITHGGTGGLAAAILGLVSPGDRVVIPDPTYSLYSDLVSMAGGVAVHVPIAADLHWDLDRLRDALAGARLFVFCNPGNPTGIVHTREELAALAGFLEGTDTVVISDEAYAALDFTGRPFTSALEIPGMAERTVYCQTFSKSYAMTGWRVGYLAGPGDLIRAAARVHNTVNGSVNTVVQDAALAALGSASADVESMRSAYAARRELMRSGLASVRGLTLSEPEGAFYFFPRYELPIGSVDMVARLRSAGVAVRPGSEFGANGENHLRLSYAASEDAIRTATERMRIAFDDLYTSTDAGRHSA
jgi:aspartate aminotransferase